MMVRHCNGWKSGPLAEHPDYEHMTVCVCCNSQNFESSMCHSFSTTVKSEWPLNKRALSEGH